MRKGEIKKERNKMNLKKKFEEKKKFAYKMLDLEIYEIV